MCDCLVFSDKVSWVGISTPPPRRVLFNPPRCPIRYTRRPLYPASPPFLARRVGRRLRHLVQMPGGAALPPSHLPRVLMHQATQIFSPNPPPFAQHPRLFSFSCFFFPAAHTPFPRRSSVMRSGETSESPFRPISQGRESPAALGALIK